MEIFSLFMLWLHVIAAVTWIGGNLILAMVIVPHFKQNLPPVQRIQLLTQIGRRFEPVVWGCVGVLFFTGIVNIFYAVDLTSPTALSGAFMRTLLIKIGLFFVLVYPNGVARYGAGAAIVCCNGEFGSGTWRSYHPKSNRSVRGCRWYPV